MARVMVRPARPSISVQRLQAADRTLGRAACAALQPLRWLRVPEQPGGGGRPRAPGVARVLLVKFWGLGSLQLLTPAVRSLRRELPGAELALLTLAQNAAFARGLGVFDEVLALDVECASWPALAGRVTRLVRGLRRRRFSRVYDFEFLTRFSALVTLATGAPWTAGFHSDRVWRGEFTRRAVAYRDDWHVARNFRALAGGEDGREVAPDELTPFPVRPADRARVEALTRAATPCAPLVVLNPNAGALFQRRRWPRARFAAVARELHARHGARCVLIGARQEAAYTAGLASRVPGAIDLAGRLSIGELCALLAGADLVVSNDSGPMHLAAALGTPTLGLFGPETPRTYGPLGARARALWRPIACSPCLSVHANKLAACVHPRAECLAGLSVERVLAEARDLLGAARPDRNQAVRCGSSC